MWSIFGHAAQPPRRCARLSSNVRAHSLGRRTVPRFVKRSLVSCSPVRAFQRLISQGHDGASRQRAAPCSQFNNVAGLRRRSLTHSAAVALCRRRQERTAALPPSRFNSPSCRSQSSPAATSVRVAELPCAFPTLPNACRTIPNRASWRPGAAQPRQFHLPSSLRFANPRAPRKNAP